MPGNREGCGRMGIWQLAPRQATILGRVNHLDAQQGTQIYSARAIPLWVGDMSTQQKLRE